ncbi:MAG: MMPL family transporter [Actinomycetota bacterium]
MSKRLYELASFSARHRWIVLATWLGAVTLITVLGITRGGSHSTNADIPGTESQVAFDLLEDRFPAQAGTSIQVVLAAEEGAELDQATVNATIDQLAVASGVVDVSDPYAVGAVTPDGRVAFAEVRYGGVVADVDEADIESLEEAVATAREDGVQVEFRGEAVDANADQESYTAEIVGLSVAVVVLMFAFGSVIAAFTPILSGMLGVLTTLMGLEILANWVSVNEFAPVLATMIGLAVGIDYALFIVSRHRQFLHEGRSINDSIARATATSGGAVLFAGMTVIIALAGLVVLNIPLLTSMGLGAALSVFVSVLLALTLLPALLAIIGTRIDALTLPFVGARTEEGGDAHLTLSARWARRVTARPAPYLVAAVTLMAVLAAPVAGLRLGVPDDGVKPDDRTERRAYDLLAEGFGPGVNGAFTVVVDLADVDAADRETALAETRGTLRAVPGVVDASPAIPNPEGDTAIIQVTPATAADDEATVDTLEAIRDQRTTISSETGAAIAVTGITAINIDQAERLLEALPLFLAIVIGLTFVLLLVVFRSVAVPAKAAVAILISILAALGVVVAVFQWGWGASLIGVEETLPLVPILPALMFAILFGLSMDYEVFILSRIKEEYAHCGDNPESVNRGLTATARIITAAALIMISVFGSFILTPTVEVKMFGVGLALAVLLDATIIRMVMVPSTMVLLRRAVWWLPGWLDRAIPHVDIEGAQLPEQTDPAPESERVPVGVG